MQQEHNVPRWRQKRSTNAEDVFRVMLKGVNQGHEMHALDRCTIWRGKMTKRILKFIFTPNFAFFQAMHYLYFTTLVNSLQHYYEGRSLK